MLRIRNEEYIKIDKDNPDKAVYFADQLHKTGRIHSEFICKIWRYSYSYKEGTIKKQRCYVFRERRININGPELYKFSLVKAHGSTCITDTLDGHQYSLLLKTIKHNPNNVGLVNYTNSKIYFCFEENDEYIYNVFYKKFYEHEQKTRKKLEDTINRKNNLCVKRTWSLKGIGEDYKYTDNEDDWVKWV